MNTKKELINYLEKWLTRPANNSGFFEGNIENIKLNNSEVKGFNSFIKGNVKNLVIENKSKIIAPNDTDSDVKPLIELLLLELKSPSKTLNNLKSIVDKLNELIPIVPSIVNLINMINELGLF